MSDPNFPPSDPWTLTAPLKEAGLVGNIAARKIFPVPYLFGHPKNFT